MWAQRFRDCFPRSHAVRPDDGRVRMGHYMVPRTMVQEGWRPPPCDCALCVADGLPGIQVRGADSAERQISELPKIA